MISSFRGKYRFLSNYYPCVVEYEGRQFDSTEHAYQAAKYITSERRKEVQEALTPHEAKRLGNCYKTELRSDWEEVKLQIMEDLVRQKFNRCPDLAKRLVVTGDEELIEGNNWNDTFWGCVETNGRWIGQNHLGKILMKIREELRSGNKTV